MTSSNEVASVELADGRAGDLPIGRRLQMHLFHQHFYQFPAFAQLGKGKRLIRTGIYEPPIAHHQRGGFHLPAFGSHGRQNFAGGGRDSSQLRAHSRRGPAAERAAVIGSKVGIGHHQVNCGNRRTQLLRYLLAQRSADVLS